MDFVSMDDIIRCSSALARQYALISLVVLGGCATTHQPTFLLFDVVVEDYRNQAPYWLAVTRNNHTYHLPINEHLVALQPGSYRISHVDFRRNVFSGKGTLRVTEYRKSKIRVREGHINYLGTMKISKVDGALEANFHVDNALIEKACAVDADTVSTSIITLAMIPDDDRKFHHRCDTLAEYPQ